MCVKVVTQPAWFVCETGIVQIKVKNIQDVTNKSSIYWMRKSETASITEGVEV